MGNLKINGNVELKRFNESETKVTDASGNQVDGRSIRATMVITPTTGDTTRSIEANVTCNQQKEADGTWPKFMEEAMIDHLVAQGTVKVSTT